MVAQDPEALLLENLPLLERLVRAACRGWRMSEADVEDFLSDVKLRLIEHDYGVLRNFQGRCSMATWLALIVQRQLLDYRARVAGRFRPSAEAQRLGGEAIRLEALVVRDRKPLHEAVELLRRGGSPITLVDAERIASRLPRRQTRATTVSLDDVDLEPAAPQERFDTSGEREAASQTVSVTLRQAIAGQTVEEQAILRMLFVAGMSVADIARALGQEQQPLYRRLRRLYAQLRDRLLDAGIDAERVRGLLETPDVDLDLGLDPASETAARPSTRTGMPYE
jgi:RNA polymerase sigma factor (sigma-70 family)